MTLSLPFVNRLGHLPDGVAHRHEQALVVVPIGAAAEGIDHIGEAAQRVVLVGYAGGVRMSRIMRQRSSEVFGSQLNIKQLRLARQRQLLSFKM